MFAIESRSDTHDWIDDPSFLGWGCVENDNRWALKLKPWPLATSWPTSTAALALICALCRSIDPTHGPPGAYPGSTTTTHLQPCPSTSFPLKTPRQPGSTGTQATTCPASRSSSQLAWNCPRPKPSRHAPLSVAAAPSGSLKPTPDPPHGPPEPIRHQHLQPPTDGHAFCS